MVEVDGDLDWFWNFDSHSVALLREAMSKPDWLANHTSILVSFLTTRLKSDFQSAISRTVGLGFSSVPSE